MSLELSNSLPLFENDVLNQVWYSNHYKTKILDGDLNWRSPKFTQWYNCASLKQEHLAEIKNNKVYLHGKPMRSYHIAHGNSGPNGKKKKRLHEIFPKPVVDWFNQTIMV